MVFVLICLSLCLSGCCSLQHDGAWVYYLVTKPKYSDKPTYATLRTSLEAMAVHMATHGVKRLAMPRIGEPPTTINTMTTTAWRAQATASALTCVNDTTLRFPLIGQNGIIFIATFG